MALNLDGGFLPNVPPNAGASAQNAALNDVINKLNGLLKTQAFSDGTNKRYLNGYQKGGFPGGDFGLKISFPGIDVSDATDAQLIFMWDYTTNIQYHRAGSARYIDTSDDNRILTGFSPTDARPGNWISKIGEDVIDLGV